MSAGNSSAIGLYAAGLRDTERALLASVVRLSRRDTRNRSQPIDLLTADEAFRADVLLVDARDPGAVAWARDQYWLSDKPVIWLDAAFDVDESHMVVRRPLQWPVVSILLARAIDHFAHRPDSLPSALGTPVRRGTRILVVDDSTVVRTQIRGHLESRGFNVAEAGDVPTAIARLQAQPADCVFMDVIMPGTDGYEGCREIKRLQQRRETPVVMLTSKSSPFDRIRGRMAGCDAYLTKPVEEQELLQVLAIVLNSRARHAGVVAMDAAPVT